ncbi:MAG: Ig-like domain-containing protein [Candidatus Sulfotelmatobacter sp.]
MDILGSLGTLATNAKNVTLPGVFAALAFALLLWPPQPYDRIPTVIDNHIDVSQMRLDASELSNLKDDNGDSLGEYLKRSTPACTVKEGADSYKFLTIPGVRNRPAVAVKNQLILDDLDRTLFRCIEEEQALQGAEDQAIKNVNALIATRIAERDGINANYQKYILALSPLQGEFKEKLACKEDEIAELQAHALNFQRIQSERTRRVNQLQRLEGEITKRLADAGRLRPTQKFDDILSGLSSHIVGFLTLVFAWGLLFDPINRTVFSFFYDNGFDEAWDEVRPQRESPGEKALKKWTGKDQAKSTGSNGQDTKPKTKGMQATIERWRSEGPRATIKRWRSEFRPSLIIIIAFLIAALVIILVWKPGSSDGLNTATIICPTPVSKDQTITITATVIVPGTSEVPTGTVTFFGAANPSGPQELNSDGVATYEIKPADAASHTVTISAKYNGDPKKFQSSASVLVMEPVYPESQTQNSHPGNLKVKPKCAGFSTFDSDKSALLAQHMLDASLAPMPPTCVPAVPDLSTLPSPPLWGPLGKCFIVMVFAWVVAYFLPGVLKSVPKEPAGDPPPNDKQVKSFLAASLEGMQMPYTSDQDLARDLVGTLANDLIEKLKKLQNSSTPEQKLADDLVQKLATDLVNRLKPKKTDAPPSTSGQNPEGSQQTPSTSQQQPDDEKKTPTASEQKLAEDLVEKLIADLKKQSAMQHEREENPNLTPTSGEQDLANELVQQLAKTLVKSLAKEPVKPLTCEQKLAKLWKKISQPPYAIGQGLMLRSDFENLQNSYYSQSLISTGLMIPLFLLVFAVTFRPQFQLGGPMLYVLFGLGEGLLLVTGVDSRHKYFTELETLISSAFLKTCAANDKPATDQSDKSVLALIKKTIEDTQVLKLTPYVLDPEPPKPPGAKESSAKADSPKTDSPEADSTKAGQEDAQGAALSAERHRILKELSQKTNVRLRTRETPASPPATAPPQSPASGKPDTPSAGTTGKPEDPSGKPGPK